MARVTGIGGVFFKSNGDDRALARWYEKNLGIALEDFGGAILKWPDDKVEAGSATPERYPTARERVGNNDQALSEVCA